MILYCVSEDFTVHTGAEVGVCDCVIDVPTKKFQSPFLVGLFSPVSILKKPNLNTAGEGILLGEGQVIWMVFTAFLLKISILVIPNVL